MALQFLNDGYFAGSVGIGEASPSADLHVNSLNDSGTVIISRSGTNIPVSTDIGSITFASHYNSAYTDYAAIKAYSNDISAVRSSLDLKVKSTSGTLLTGMTVYGTNSGVNVGIGTTTPDYLLDLYKSTGTTSSATGTTLQRLWNYVGADLSQQKTFIDFVFQDDNDNEYPQVRIGAEVGQNGDANTQELEGSGAFVVYTNNATGVGPGTPTGLEERFRVDYQGNVGIGTDSPTKRLEISESGNGNSVEAIFRMIGTNTTGSGSNVSEIVSRQVVGGGAGESAMDLRVRDTADTFASPSTIMTLEGAGNVGIGTDSPDSILDIVGDNPILTIRDVDTSTTTASATLRLAESGAGGTLNRYWDVGLTPVAEFVIGSDGTERIRITSAGGIQFNSYGAGVLVTDASGNITAVVDPPVDGITFNNGATITNQINTDVDTGTETIASVAIATHDSAFFDFVIKKGLNVRSGTVYACHDGDTTPLVAFTETSTQDLGDTSDVTLSVVISGTSMELQATTTSDNWSIKSLIRAI